MPAEPRQTAAWRAFPGRAAWIALAAPLACGCAASVDMVAAAGAERATMTVPSTTMRDEVRLYPDYGPIGASILVDDAAPSDEKRPAAPKKGKP
jgi:hypothetical protein